MCPSSSSFFFLNDTAPTEIYTLPLHDALPIWSAPASGHRPCAAAGRPAGKGAVARPWARPAAAAAGRAHGDRKSTRLNSSHSQISYAVFCLKKKKRLGKLNVCDGEQTDKCAIE